VKKLSSREELQQGRIGDGAGATIYELGHTQIADFITLVGHFSLQGEKMTYKRKVP
jgi:hypothetical protein